MNEPGSKNSETWLKVCPGHAWSWYVFQALPWMSSPVPQTPSVPASAPARIGDSQRSHSHSVPSELRNIPFEPTSNWCRSVRRNSLSVARLLCPYSERAV